MADEYDDLLFLDDEENDIVKSVDTRARSASRPTTPKSEPKRAAVGMEDVIEQGSEYKGPKLDGKKADTTRAARNSMRPTRPEQPERETNPKLKLYIGLGAGGLLLVILLLVFGVKAYNNMILKQQQAHTDELLEGVDDPDDEYEYERTYTSKEREALRIAGFTGTEIEEFQYFGYDPAEKVREVEEARALKYEQEIAPYLDAASDEFKELLANTWVGQEEFKVSSNTDEYNYRTTTLNLDYEKITPTGVQLFLKVYLNEEQIIFMPMEPSRWVQIADKGNIVVKINYVEMDNGSIVVLDMYEIIN